MKARFSPAFLRLTSLLLSLLLLLQCLPMTALGAEQTNIAPNATVTTSYVSSWENLYAIQKTDTPASSASVSGDQYGNWPSSTSGKTNWVEYSFQNTQRIDSSRVYWFEDRDGIYAPEKASLQYFNGTDWIDLGPVGTETDCFNENSFFPILTQKVRLTMTGSGGYATGVKRWQLFGQEVGDSISLDNTPAKIQGAITVDNLNGDAAFSVTVDCDDSRSFFAQLSLLDEDGSLVAAEKTPFTVQGGETFTQDFRITVPSPLMVECVVLDEDGLTPVTYPLRAQCTPFNDDIRLFTAADLMLTDGIFKDAQDTGETFLLDLDVDRLCASVYRYSRKYKNGEIQMPAAPYGGWESSGDKGLNGHSVGHYLSACSEMYLQTGNSEYLTRMNRAVELIAAVQDEDGFVGGFDRQHLDDSLSDPDNISSGGPNGAYLGGIWAPWYSVHKILQGTIDVYTVTGNETALAIAEGIASYAGDKAAPLNDVQMEVMLGGEHGGINESLANLYEVTGNPEYIELAKRYSHKAILDPLANGVDSLSGYHANTQIPKIVGAAKIYLLTGDVYYRDAAEFFWKTVVENRSYANGGNSNAEHFTNPGTEPLSDTSTETCNTYNMLKLTELLYRINPKPEYIDYYENALYNHILGSQNPQGHKTYYIDLTQGGHKTYRNAFECCVGTGMENHTRYTHMIYCTDEDALQVNLFINSSLHWEEGGMTLTQQTEFPVQDTTTLTVDSASGEEKTIRLRVPGWTKAPQVLVNGEAADVAEENGYLSITRNWVAGDTITYTLPMESSIYVSRDDEHLIAFKYGPILLAGELEGSVKFIVSDEDPATLPVRTSEDALLFELNDCLRPGSSSITLKPFYEFISERHMVYWTLFSTEEYEDLGGDAYNSLSDRMDSLSIDRVIPNNSKSEQSHGLTTTGTSSSGYDNSVGAGWRHATGDSSFSYQLAVEPGKTNYLACAFWGNDGGNRTFDILVDDVVIAEDFTLNQKLPGKLFYQYYPLDPADLAGKASITVTFRSKEGSTAGGVFDVRTMRARILPDDLSGPYEAYCLAEPTMLGATQGDAQQAADYHYTVDNGWAFAPDAYITIDLQRSYTVKRLLLMPASKLGAMPKDCEIYVSNEAPTYAETNAGLTVAGLRDADKAATLSFEEGGFRDAQVLPSSAEGRYVTIHVLSTQNGAAGAVAEIALEITTETKAETAAKAAEAAQAAAEAAQAAAKEARKAAEAAAETAGRDRSAAEAAAEAAENALNAAQTALEAALAAEAAAKSADANAAQSAAASAEAAVEAAASAAEAAKAQSAAQTAQAKAEAAQKAAEDAAEAAQEASEATAENKAAAEAAKAAAQKAQEASEAAAEEARKAAEAAGASDASAARKAAEAAASAAEAAASAAEAAKAQSAAQAAQAKAEAAAKAAEDANHAAQEASETTAADKAAAEAAKAATQKAQAAAEAAAEAAREAASAADAADASAARKAAEAAASAAEAAAFAAEAAKAQSAAQAAQAKAEAAQKAAEDAQLSAEQAREEALAAQLGAAKYYALTQLALFAATVDNTGRTEEEMAAWSAAMEDGIAAIEAAKDPAAVTAALEETLGKLAMDPQDTCPSQAFTDVPGKDNWAHEGIDYCVENDLMNGVSETAFHPQGTVTRAQLVTILYRAAGEPDVAQGESFLDVPSGKWYSKAIAWAAQSGIVNGIGNDLFGPEQSITREQIAAILYRYEGSPETDGSLNAFPDHTAVSGFAAEAMVWATQKGLINGVTSGDTLILSPKSNASRAQIAAIMMRCLLAK